MIEPRDKIYNWLKGYKPRVRVKPYACQRSLCLRVVFAAPENLDGGQERCFVCRARDDARHGN